jgi:hypothetical protein
MTREEIVWKNENRVSGALLRSAGADYDAFVTMNRSIPRGVTSPSCSSTQKATPTTPLPRR